MPPNGFVRQESDRPVDPHAHSSRAAKEEDDDPILDSGRSSVGCRHRGSEIPWAIHR